MAIKEEPVTENDESILLDGALERIEIENKRKDLEAIIKERGNLWNYSPLGLEAKKAAMTMLSTKTGMFAKVPIICKGEKCPYREKCTLAEYDMAPFGEACPIETARIEQELLAYSNEFGINLKSQTDKALISEIIVLTIHIDRCIALMAKEQTPVIDVVIGVNENGEEIRQPAVSKAQEAYERLSKRRDAKFDMMMATRKNRKTDNEDNNKFYPAELIKNMSKELFEIEKTPAEFRNAETEE